MDPLVKENDKLCKQIVAFRERGKCFICGAPGTDLAHLYGRRYLATRWDTHRLGNCHILCRKDHAYVDEHLGGKAHYKQILEKRAGTASAVERIASRRLKSFPGLERKAFVLSENARLKQELKDIQEKRDG